MLDFTSALYLGLKHPSGLLRPWRQLTTGRPAVLDNAQNHRNVAAALATLTGCESATLGSSTLHLFWDLFGMIGHRCAIYMDAGAYPIARWGIERAAARRVPLQVLRHYDGNAISDALRRNVGRLQPIVVADGFCPGCGRPAPVPAYLEAIRKLGGLLILDDTQALGIFGHSPHSAAPYGMGGGGSLRLHGVASPSVLLVSSLAKAFGVPVALLAGSETIVRTFEARSETRMHTSPPSSAVVHAAERALAVNRESGDALRWRLLRNVRHLRCGLGNAGLWTAGGLFPAQTLELGAAGHARALHRRLRERGIRTVLHATRERGQARTTLLVTADHRRGELDRVIEAIAREKFKLDGAALAADVLPSKQEMRHERQTCIRD